MSKYSEMDFSKTLRSSRGLDILKYIFSHFKALGNENWFRDVFVFKNVLGSDLGFGN